MRNVKLTNLNRFKFLGWILLCIAITTIGAILMCSANKSDDKFFGFMLTAIGFLLSLGTLISALIAYKK